MWKDTYCIKKYIILKEIDKSTNIKTFNNYASITRIKGKSVRKVETFLTYIKGWESFFNI